MNKKKAEAVAYGDGCHGGSCRGDTNHTHTALLIVKYNCLVGIPINMCYNPHWHIVVIIHIYHNPHQTYIQ